MASLILSVLNVLWPGAALIWRRELFQGLGYFLSFGVLSAFRHDIGAMWAFYVFVLAQVHFHRIRKLESAKNFGIRGRKIIWITTILAVLAYSILYGPTWTHGATIRYPVILFSAVIVALTLPALMLTRWLKPSSQTDSSGMRMQPVDTMGTLYSSGGLRFGGFQTLQFLELTEDLEAVRPGVRTEIVGEAHYLAFWLSRFPEILFLLGVLLSESLIIAAVCLVGGYVLEIARFYTLGASRTISQLCRAWEWAKLPAFAASIASLWSQGWFWPTVLGAFLVVQGWLNLITLLLAFVLRLPLFKLFFKLFAHDRNNLDMFNMEGLAVLLVINQWRKSLDMTTKAP